jgi:hypothetical protein
MLSQGRPSAHATHGRLGQHGGYVIPGGALGHLVLPQVRDSVGVGATPLCVSTQQTCMHAQSGRDRTCTHTSIWACIQIQGAGRVLMVVVVVVSLILARTLADPKARTRDARLAKWGNIDATPACPTDQSSHQTISNGRPPRQQQAHTDANIRALVHACTCGHAQTRTAADVACAQGRQVPLSDPDEDVVRGLH